MRRHCSQPVERVIALINPILRGWTVDLSLPDQNLRQLRSRPAFDEQVEEVGLAVHRDTRTPGRTIPSWYRPPPRMLAQPLDPAERLPVPPAHRLAFLLGFRGLGRVNAAPARTVPTPPTSGLTASVRLQVQADGPPCRSDSSRWSPAPASRLRRVGSGGWPGPGSTAPCQASAHPAQRALAMGARMFSTVTDALGGLVESAGNELTKALTPFAAPVTQHSETRPSARDASGPGARSAARRTAAPPELRPRSRTRRPARRRPPAATRPGAGVWRVSRTWLQRVHIHRRRAFRRRVRAVLAPAPCWSQSTRTQFAARTLAPVCSVSSIERLQQPGR